MSTLYQVTIQLSNATVQALSDSGYALFAFLPVQATAAGGQPVLWLHTKSVAENIQIDWSSTYAAYISQSAIVVNSTIAMQSEAPISFGQILQVGQGGSVSVTSDGPADAMSVLNTTTTPYTCGLAVALGSVTSPIAAFPLYANSLDAIAPMEKVLLVFESYPAQAGQILERTLAQGLFVDVAGGAARTVSFDINNGWSFGGAPWGQVIAANTPLNELLIKQAPLQLSASVAEMNASLR